MDQSAADETVVLMPHMDCRGPENEGIHYFIVVEGEEGNERGNEDDAYREACHWIFF